MSTDPITTQDPDDSSPYIRTYAKDVATLTGQKASAPVTAPKKHSKLVHHDDSLIVSETPSTKPADLSQLEHEAESIDAKNETTQETEERIQDLGNSRSSGILQSISLPSIQPGDIVQPIASSPIAPDATEASREALLARLRAKAGHSANILTPPVAPTAPPTPIVPPLIEPVPLPPIPEPILPTTPVPAPSQPLPLHPQEESEPNLSPFHSFSSDFADRIDAQHASTFSVLAAEKDAAPQPIVRRKSAPILPILAGIVLVIAGAAGVYATYHFMSEEAPVAAVSAIPSLIVPDEKIALSGSGTQLLQALAQQANQSIPADTVLLTYITTATTTKQGVVEAPDTGGAFLSALNLQAPDVVLRNVDPTSMVGIVNDGAQTRPFFILRVTSYDLTFAGMLDWEPTIGSDLGLLYPAYPAIVPVQSAVATSTTATTTSKTKTAAKAATTTPVATRITVLPTFPPQFIDEVVENHSARALKDTQGRTILIYGYADKQTLIIARDEAAFSLLLGRLEANQQ